MLMKALWHEFFFRISVKERIDIVCKNPSVRIEPYKVIQYFHLRTERAKQRGLFVSTDQMWLSDSQNVVQQSSFGVLDLSS